MMKVMVFYKWITGGPLQQDVVDAKRTKSEYMRMDSPQLDRIGYWSEVKLAILKE